MPSPSEPVRPHYELIWPGKRPPAAPPASPLHFRDVHLLGRVEEPDTAERLPPLDRLIHGDNLAVMGSLLPDFRGKIDLIYLDPPFDAGQEFRMQAPLGEGNGVGRSRDDVLPTAAYRDVWGRSDDSYLQMLYDRLPLIRELLSETGSLIVHVNWRVSHLVQTLLDEVFGAGERRSPGSPGFRCEVVWGYGGGASVRNVYRRKHDNLFWYTRSDRWTFEPQYRPYSAGTRERGLTAVKGERYSLREQGAALETWWTGPEVQKILSPTAYENWKYPTQKPESLLERIIRGHSRPGDLVADFFCGSGTTGAVAMRLDRRWIMADSSPLAIHTCRKRLAAFQDARSRQGEAAATFGVFALEESADRSGELHATLRGDTEGGSVVQLSGFTPGPLPDREPPDPNECWKYLDYWAVDWDYQGEPFRHQWRAYRSPADRRLPLHTAAHPAPGPRIAVKAIDVLGRETLALLEP